MIEVGDELDAAPSLTSASPPPSRRATTTRLCCSTRRERRRSRRASRIPTRTRTRAAARRRSWLDVRPDDLVWCTAGTGWAKSIWNVLLGPWSHGAEVVIHEGTFDAAERFDLVKRLGVNVLCQSPTEYRMMAKLDELDGDDLSSVRHAVSAGEPLNAEVIKLFRERFGLTLYDGYGQTENSLLVANTPNMEIRPGSMGLPTPGHRVAVIDEAGSQVPPGVEGDIALARHAADAVRGLLARSRGDAGDASGGLVPHRRPRDRRPRRLPLVRRPLRRRHPQRRLPDRPLRGRERAARASRRGRERRRSARPMPTGARSSRRSSSRGRASPRATSSPASCRSTSRR